MQYLRGFHATVRFTDPSTTLIVRPPNQVEEGVLEAYVRHSVGCRICTRLGDHIRTAPFFCPGGRGYARQVEELFYLRAGRVRAISRGAVPCAVVVELGAAFSLAEVLIRVMHENRLCKARKRQCAHPRPVEKSEATRKPTFPGNHPSHAVAHPQKHRTGERHRIEMLGVQRAGNHMLKGAAYSATGARKTCERSHRDCTWETHRNSSSTQPRTRPSNTVRKHSRRWTRMEYSRQDGEGDFMFRSDTVIRNQVRLPLRLVYTRDERPRS